jgi:hypothetical protein
MAPVPLRRRRLALAIAIVLAILPTPATRTPAAAAGPATGSASVVTVGPAPDASRPFRINLARNGDYVRQANFVQCVGASVQMMLNIIRPGADHSLRTQHRLQVLARSQSGPRPDGRRRQGAGVFGWAAALNLEGAGAYAVVGADSLQGAMRIAARAIVDHGRPVGLLVWQGRHAWVMSGFEATGDPRNGPFRVTRAYILDPLYPHGSKAWGSSPTPGTATSVATVGRQFLARRRHSEWNALPGMAELAGKWVLVVPVDDPAPPNPVVVAGLAPRPAPHRVATREAPRVRWIRGPVPPG